MAMIDIKKIIKLRNSTLLAIDITKEDKDDFEKNSQSHSYRLGKLHCLEDFSKKLNDLIIQA